jgi:glutathione peroxidase
LLVTDRFVPLLFASFCVACLAVKAGQADEPAKSAPAPALNFQVKDIDGKTVDLAKTYQGKVLLVVNTASQCGATPQYAGLETIYGKYKTKGLEVLAFPANEFGSQEPGSNSEIKSFCESTYHVTFPLFSKIVVKGEGQHPLYAELTREQPAAKTLPESNFRAKLIGYGVDPVGPSEILWNFEKFLVDRSGKVVDRFAPDVPPNDPMVVAAIEKQLG